MGGNVAKYIFYDIKPDSVYDIIPTPTIKSPLKALQKPLKAKI